MEKIDKRLRSFRLHSLIAIIALALEFVLGVYTALFVEFPENLSGADAWPWSMTKSLATGAHIALGTLLLLISIATLGYAIAIKERKAIAASAAGFSLVGLAWLSGAAFLSDMANDAFSFAMSLAFIGAMLSYGLACYFARPDRNSARA